MILNIYCDGQEVIDEKVIEVNKWANQKRLDVFFHPIRSIEELHEKQYEFIVYVGKKKESISYDFCLRKASIKSLKRVALKALKKPKRQKIAPNFRNETIIAVMEEKELAMQMSLAYSNKLSIKTLIIDADRLTPSYDTLMSSLNPKRGFRACLSSLQNMKNNSLSIEDYTFRNANFGNVSVLTDPPMLYAYEANFQEEYTTLLKLAIMQFDRVIIKVNRFIYDAYTLISLVNATKIIVPIKPDIEEIRNYKHLFDFLVEKQGIKASKVNYLTYKESKVSPMIYMSLEKQWLGNISTSKKEILQLLERIEEKM